MRTDRPSQACEGCRQRKTRCDEKKPACGRCVRLGLDCVYAETPLSRKELHALQLTETMERMEEKLDNLSNLVLKNHNRGDEPTPSFPGRVLSQSSPQRSLASGLVLQPTTVASTPVPGYDVALPHPIDAPRIKEELSLSQRHFTAPQYLLCWPCSSLRLDQEDLGYPTGLEAQLPRLSRSTSPPRCMSAPSAAGSWITRLSLAQVSSLTRAYFTHFHPACPILSESYFYSHTLNQAVRTGFASDLQTCMLLLVCCLGSIVSSSTGSEDWSQDEPEQTGLGFFNLAINILRDVERPDWTSVQCLLLTAFVLHIRTYLSQRTNYEQPLLFCSYACLRRMASREPSLLDDPYSSFLVGSLYGDALLLLEN